jgi:hypothetical protein
MNEEINPFNQQLYSREFLQEMVSVPKPSALAEGRHNLFPKNIS